MKHTKNREMLLADKAVVETEHRKVWAEIQAKIDPIQMYLDSKVALVNAFDRELAMLLISGKNLNHQLQLRSGTDKRPEP